VLRQAWTVAIETLSWVELLKLSVRMALSKTIKQLGIKNPDAVRYAYSLVIEVIRRKNLLDAFINSVLRPRTLNEFNLGVQAFLRLYIYQTRIVKNWTKVDIEEAEKIAKLGRSILGWKNLREIEPFLGVLLTRKMDSILKGQSEEEKVALQTFNPTWFVKYCFNLLGRNQAIEFLKVSTRPLPIYIRLNTINGSQESILKNIASEHTKLERSEPLLYSYKVLRKKQPLSILSSFQKGLFYIQDKGSCFAVEVADPKPGMTVLDVCAAPGAKTTYLAQLMRNQGRIFSIDYSDRRMKVWKQEVLRMGVGIAEPIIADASIALPLIIEADMAILDPPCTSTGVFAKQPTAKWRLTKKSIKKMAEIQWLLINSIADNVKEGGTLTYTTCSITVEENEMVVERFLKLHPEFGLEDIDPKLGLPGRRGLNECQRLYPHLHGSNGFFIAKLRKKIAD
jgi:16S rRNA (cytosine967-C5)-methyltransferase